MPQVTVFNSQQQIIDRYIISDELFNELTRIASIFELDQIPISFLEKLQNRFSTFLSRRVKPENIDSIITQNYSWYWDLLALLEYLHRLSSGHLALELTRS